MSRPSTGRSELLHVLSEYLPQSLQQLIVSGKISKYTDLTASTRAVHQLNSGMFARPSTVREAVQTLPSSSMDRSVLCARTRARGCGRELGGRPRDLSAESGGSTSPVSWPETPRRIEPCSHSGPTRSGITDPDKHMTRSNRPHEANDPKSTAQLTARRRTNREIETNANSQAARAGGRQVRLGDFEFVSASQLRHDDRDVDSAAAKKREEGKR